MHSKLLNIVQTPNYSTPTCDFGVKDNYEIARAPQHASHGDIRILANVKAEDDFIAFFTIDVLKHPEWGCSRYICVWEDLPYDLEPDGTFKATVEEHGLDITLNFKFIREDEVFEFSKMLASKAGGKIPDFILGGHQDKIYHCSGQFGGAEILRF